MEETNQNSQTYQDFNSDIYKPNNEEDLQEIIKYCFKLTQIRKRKKNQNYNLEIKFIKFSATLCGCSIKIECLTFDKITILELMISFAIFLF